MPSWALSLRIDEIQPTFDVFCLGKLLWSMVSGSPNLPLWHYDQPEFNLETKFPGRHSIRLANYLLSKCIVESEKDCLPDGTALLKVIDEVLSLIDSQGDVVDPKLIRRCQVCGQGNYEESDAASYFTKPVGKRVLKIWICDHCGNVQWFAVDLWQKLTAPDKK